MKGPERCRQQKFERRKRWPERERVKQAEPRRKKDKHVRFHRITISVPGFQNQLLVGSSRGYTNFAKSLPLLAEPNRTSLKTDSRLIQKRLVARDQDYKANDPVAGDRTLTQADPPSSKRCAKSIRSHL
jgi:hypothetical protein